MGNSIIFLRPFRVAELSIDVSVYHDWQVQNLSLCSHYQKLLFEVRRADVAESITNFYEVIYFQDSEWSFQETITDSSGAASIGCSSSFRGQWTYFQWPNSWAGTPIHKTLYF